ncbi:unnamed protein product [Allacma fusca]|uniref:Major facilitator superfamily (MFS) profile domain-containing protein n=1 Tax=Allacma fusca TaxID=39272 RepID=A0A8J2PAF6_9HEXA|nr:unnamed protein product [Allacma fusca]
MNKRGEESKWETEPDIPVLLEVYNQCDLHVFGRSLNPHGAAIVVVFLQLLGSMTSGLLIDTAGRLPLLTLSNLFISGSFFGFGLYNWMEESLPPSQVGFGPSLDWIPLTCVLFFTLFFSIGIGPISWLMVGELFPLEYRNFGGALSTSFSYACAFAAVKTYVDINNHIGLYGAFWIYSAVSIAGLFFVCCVVPETRGVELEEMEQHSITMAALHPIIVNDTAYSQPNPLSRITRNTSIHLNFNADNTRRSEKKSDNKWHYGITLD